MGKGRYSIVFNSPTGNTKKLADTIYAVLAKENCDYFGVPKEGGLYSEMLYIGFWTDKGNADAVCPGLRRHALQQRHCGRAALHR